MSKPFDPRSRPPMNPLLLFIGRELTSYWYLPWAHLGFPKWRGYPLWPALGRLQDRLFDAHCANEEVDAIAPRWVARMPKWFRRRWLFATGQWPSVEALDRWRLMQADRTVRFPGGPA